MFAWFRRHWVSRDEFDEMKDSYESRIAILEAALEKHEGLKFGSELPDNLSLELMRRLNKVTRFLH